MDASQWSAEGQRRLGYLSPPLYYEDRVFACRSCQCESVFTALQQKCEFEEKKAYPLRQRVLCPPCFSRRVELKAANAHYSALWIEQKPAMLRDLRALLRWLDVLQELPAFGGRRDTARIRMLESAAVNAA